MDNKHNIPIFIISKSETFKTDLRNFIEENYKGRTPLIHSYNSVNNCFKDIDLFCDNNFIIVDMETNDMVKDLSIQLSSHLLHNIVLIRTNDKSDNAQEMLYPEGEEYVINAPNVFLKIFDILNYHKKTDKQSHRFTLANYIFAGILIIALILLIVSLFL